MDILTLKPDRKYKWFPIWVAWGVLGTYWRRRGVSILWVTQMEEGLY